MRRATVPGRSTAQSTSRAVAATALSHLALPLSAVLTGPILARALGPEMRGELAAVLAPIFLAALIFTVGLPEAATFLVASRRHPPRSALLVASTMAFAWGLLAVVAVHLLAPLLLRNYPEQVPLLRLLALLLPLSLVGLALRGVVHGLSAFSVLNAERWFSVFSRLIVIAVLAVTGLLTVASAAWVTNATALVAAAFLLWRARRLLSERPAVRTAAAPPWRALPRYGFRVWLGSLSVLLILRVDQALMAPLTAAEQLGYYAVAVAVAELPGAAFNAVRDVVFSTSTSRGETDVVARACRLSISVLGPACVLLVVLAPPAVSLVFGEDFAPAARMAQILFVAALPAGFAAIVGAGLLALGRPGRLGVAQGAVAALNVLLVLVLVPTLGGVGASLASLGSYTLLAIVAAHLFTRATEVRLRELVVPRASDLRDLLVQLRTRMK